MKNADGAVERALASIDRAVTMLDRGMAEGYRVGAFLKGRAVLKDLTDAELSQRARTRTLTELPGIGSSIASVVEDAVLGHPSAYLAKLDAETAVSATPAGSALRAMLRGDLHTHTDWSDGGASITEMAAAAAELGHQYLAVTDHSGRLTVARGLDRSRLRRQLDEHRMLRALIEQETGLTVLTGIEVDINEDGSLDADDEVLAELDIVVGSVHAKMRMAAEQMTARLLRAVTNPHVDVLGHCTGRKVTGRGRPEMQADWDTVLAACARSGTAVEINCRPERLDPPRRLLRLAAEMGCVFSIDSDAHAPGQLEWQPLGCDRAAEVGIGDDRIVNAWPLERLLDWTKGAPELG